MAEKNEEKTPTFEQAISRLEEIVSNMESGKEDLDSMIKAFEEGQNLVKFCSKKLREVERKVEMLTKQPDGSVKAEKFSENF